MGSSPPRRRGGASPNPAAIPACCARSSISVLASAIGACNGPTSEAGSIGATSSRAMPSWVAASWQLRTGGLDDRGVDVAAGREARDRRAVPTGGVTGLREGGPSRRRELDRLRGSAQGVDVLAQPRHQPDQSDRRVAERGDGVVTSRSCRAEQVLGLIELTRLERRPSIPQVVARLREGVRGLNAGPRQVGNHQDEEDADATEHPGPDAPPASSRRCVCAVLHRGNHGTRGPARRLACGWNRR